MAIPTNVTLGRVGPPALSRTERNVLLSSAASPDRINTQPWQFVVNGPNIEVYADSERALYWSVDPFGRQAVISCAAALLNLRVAGAHLGRDVDVVINPTATQGLLATVVLGPRGRGNHAEAALYPAIGPAAHPPRPVRAAPHSGVGSVRADRMRARRAREHRSGEPGASTVALRPRRVRRRHSQRVARI